MLTQFYTHLTLMDGEYIPDGLGGTCLQVSPARPFLGNVVLQRQTERIQAGHAVQEAKSVLVHEQAVQLSPGCIVRREADGVLFRITGDDEKPPCGRLDIRRCLVERLEGEVRLA